MSEHQGEAKEEEKEAEQIKKPADRTGRNLLILAVVCGVLIIFVFAIVLLQPEEPRTLQEVIQATLDGEETENNYLYNGFAFVRVDEKTWVTLWQKEGQMYQVPLRFSPRELVDVLIQGELNESFDSSNLFITFDPRKENLRWEALAATELTINLAQVFGVEPTAACMYNETIACATRPIVSCQDADKGVIVLREADEVLVDLKGNCMILQGPGEDLLKAVDRVLLIWYGIMEREDYYIAEVTS
jgi:hypothetical protein